MRPLQVVAGALTLAVVGVGSAAYAVRIAEAAKGGSEAIQQLAVDRLWERLRSQDVPVTSMGIKQDGTVSAPSTIDVLEITVQSLGDGDRLSAEDAIYANAIGREVKLAHRRGLDVDAWRVKTINSAAKPILTVIIALDDQDNSAPGFDKPGRLSTEDARLFLTNSLNGGIPLKDAVVSRDDEGLLSVQLAFEASMAEANLGVSSLIDRVRTFVDALNVQQGAAIAVCRVRLHSLDGKPILTYVRDVEYGRITAWQADELTNEWLPHPRDVVAQ